MNARFKSITDRVNTCTTCGLQAVFMYKDALNQPLCPKCNKHDIEEHKRLMQDILDSESEEDELEFTLDSDLDGEYTDLVELKF